MFKNDYIAISKTDLQVIGIVFFILTIPAIFIYLRDHKSQAICRNPITKETHISPDWKYKQEGSIIKLKLNHGNWKQFSASLCIVSRIPRKIDLP